MTRPCDRCGAGSVIFVRYSGAHLCSEHFVDFYEKRVRKAIRQQADLGAGPPGQDRPETFRFGIAISGGKDSVVLLRVLHDILKDRNDIELVAITIDEGIDGYRPESIDIAARNAEAVGAEHLIYSFRDLFGKDLDDMVDMIEDGGPCSWCGVFRRAALNRAAKEADVRYLVTGHNLDDISQTVLMNHLRGDVDRIGRMAPHLTVREGLVPHLVPLRWIPERENLLYAMLKGYEVHEGECPYAELAHRNLHRNLLMELEGQTPGTRHAMVRGADRVKELLALEPHVQEGSCSRCGSTTESELCKCCVLVETIQNS